MHGDGAVVGVVFVSGRKPRQRLGVGFVTVEEVERLVEKLVANPRYTAGYEGIESIVILDLAAAGIVLGAVGDQGAIARHLLQAARLAAAGRQRRDNRHCR